jgi:hypothetical protein
MKKIITVLVFLFQLSGFGQNIRLRIVEKVSGEPIGLCQSFIIDPVDNMVVGFAISTIEGDCNFKLIRPLKSEKFQLKLCDMHLVDSIVELDYGYLWFYTVEWEVRKTIKWLTVYYNKKGIIDYNYEMDLYSCTLDYSNPYQDSVNTYNERESAKLEAEYQREYNQYLKEISRLDSLSKIYPGTDYLIGPPPILVEQPILELYTFISEQGVPPGGVDTYLNKIHELKILQPEWEKKKPFKFVFKLNGYEFLADTLIVFDDQNKVMKKSKKICENMRGIMNTKWSPMKFNGRSIRLRRDIDYVIEFIYREE